MYGEPIKKMFEAPFSLIMPNLKLPPFNDSGEVNIQQDIYELAFARFNEPIFLSALQGSRRQNSFALWFGVDQLPTIGAAEMKSHNMTDSGYSVLQRGQGEQATWLCLKYDKYGSGHGHFDKNNFILYSHGQVLFPNPVTRYYGSKLHAEWDRVTLAHNTLVVDETSQTPSTGKSLAFGNDHGTDYAMTDAGNIYKGVRFVRTVVMLNKDLLLFADHIIADKPRILDIICHFNGQWDQQPAGESIPLPIKEGYQYLQNVSAFRSSENNSLKLVGNKDTHVSIVLARNDPTEIITATGIGKSTNDRIPMVIYRRLAKETIYVWAVSLDASLVNIVENHAKNGAFEINVDNKKNKWNIKLNTYKPVVKIVHTNKK